MLMVLGVTPEDYISFFGMRAHDVLMGILVSEYQIILNRILIV